MLNELITELSAKQCTLRHADSALFHKQLGQILIRRYQLQGQFKVNKSSTNQKGVRDFP